jgi:methionyl-tRNA synthetase
MSDKDPQVGKLHDGGKPVFQCRKTGLLYVWGDAPKRYVSVMGVALDAAESKEKPSGKRRR